MISALITFDEHNDNNNNKNENDNKNGVCGSEELKKYFDKLYQELKLSSLDDWYSVALNVIDLPPSTIPPLTDEEEGGLEGMALIRLLKQLYPDHSWNDLLYARKTKKFWTKANTALFLHLVHQRLTVTEVILDESCWYFVPSFTKLFEALNAMSLLRKYKGSYINLLSDFYPHYSWDITRFVDFYHSSNLLAIYLSTLSFSS